MKNPMSPLKTLGLLVILFTSVAAMDVEFKSKDSAYSEYLTAIYARQEGNVERATENYLRVIKKDPGNLQILEEAFTYFIYTGDFKNALDLAKKIQDLSSTHTSSAMFLSLEAFRKGKKEDLQVYLEKAKGLGFDVLIGPLMNAWLLADDGKTDEAIGAMSQLQLNPGFEPFFAEHRAFMLDKAGRVADAEAAYLAILARPEITSLQPLFAYGVMLQTQKRGDEAMALYKEFQPSVPNNRQLREAIARLENGKKPVSLIEDPKKAVAMALLRAGVELTREQAFYPAVVYARFAQYLNPNFDEGLLFLGNMLSTENNPGLALAAYGGVDPKGPFGETALLRQAMVLSFHDRRDEGIALVKELLDQNPDSYDALVSLGDLYRTNEDYKNALPFYERAIAQKETVGADDWFLLFTRAISYERLGMWEEAEADFLKALEFEPDNPDILNYLGYSWIDRGMNLEQGRAMIEKAVASEPDNGFIVDSLGWAQYLMGEYEEAVMNLERAVTLEPGDPTINDHLGDAYWKVGREREARFQWDHALKLNPTREVEETLNKKMKYGLSEGAEGNEPL